jgi:hypothetical protein
MTIAVRCACGQSLKAKDELAGKRVKCPGCGRIAVLPLAVTTAAGADLPGKAVTTARPRAAAVPRPKKVLLPGGQTGERPDTPEAPPGLDGLPSRYTVDLGAWFRAANPHYGTLLGPTIGYLMLFLLIMAGLFLLTLILIGYLGFFLLLPHLAAGPTIVCLAQLKGRKWTLGTFFTGFRRYGTWLALELLLDLLILACFLPGLLVMVLLALLNAAAGVDPDSPVMAVTGTISLLALLGGVVAAVYVWFRAGIFARQLVIDRGCGAVEAIKGSWRLAGVRFWGLFGAFLLVLLGVEVVSLLTCGIGMLFALPYGLLVLNAGYLHITGTRDREGTGVPNGPIPSGGNGPTPLPAAKPSPQQITPLVNAVRRRPWVAGGAAAAGLAGVALVALLVGWLRSGGPGSAGPLPGAAGPRLGEAGPAAGPDRDPAAFPDRHPRREGRPRRLEPSAAFGDPGCLGRRCLPLAAAGRDQDEGGTAVGVGSGADAGMGDGHHDHQ